MKVFFHNDNDGVVSAYLVCAAMKGSVAAPDLVMLNYAGPFPIQLVSKHEAVWIVDYSIKPDEMRALLQLTENVTWIDHHKSAIKDYANFEFSIPGLRVDGEAACALTWRYLHPDEKPPRFVELVADRDVWTWKYGYETAHFNAGLGLYPMGPLSETWPKLLESPAFVKEVLRVGTTICEYNRLRFAKTCRHASFETMLDGYRCLALNIPSTGSEVFGGTLGALPDTHDIFIVFYMDRLGFAVSLYSKKVDVSVVAKAHGGGGHAGASGFRCKTLPFEPII